jgi:hypothetical protein
LRRSGSSRRSLRLDLDRRDDLGLGGRRLGRGLLQCIAIRRLLFCGYWRRMVGATPFLVEVRDHEHIPPLAVLLPEGSESLGLEDRLGLALVDRRAHLTATFEKKNEQVRVRSSLFQTDDVFRT